MSCVMICRNPILQNANEKKGGEHESSKELIYFDWLILT